MKKLILILALTAFIGCKNNKEQDSLQKTESINHTVETVNNQDNNEDLDVYYNTWTKEIKTNNGDKWQANTETNDGVERMKGTIKLLKTNTLNDYHELAKKLNIDKNYVIKNCTMQGASHDNLHIWLLPLMEKIDVLSDIKNLEAAAKLKNSIEENITAYYTYFK